MFKDGTVFNPIDESLWEPEKFHTICCKKCKKESKELKRYTRLCNDCRNVTEENVQWDTWSDLP